MTRSAERGDDVSCYQSTFFRDTPPLSGSGAKWRSRARHGEPPACHSCSALRQLPAARGKRVRARRVSPARRGQRLRRGAPRRLRTRTPPVVGQRVSAFQERGATAAAATRMRPRARSEPRLAGSPERGPATAHARFPRGSARALSTRSGRLSPRCEKRDVRMEAECEMWWR